MYAHISSVPFLRATTVFALVLV